jgi:hypothetical protein
MIQYSATLISFCDGGDYWIPAFAGMTAGLELNAGKPRRRSD